ncbi:MAG: ankyrin repeat domain-containing protein, partial [Clostridiales Family XIII bacterium]|nr:ankyrin repeat domain-containing protein [Clostridiales Family XIII bacterium]
MNKGRRHHIVVGISIKSTWILILLAIVIGASSCSVIKSAVGSLNFEEQYEAAIFLNSDDLELIKEYIESEKVEVNGTLFDSRKHREVSPLFLIQAEHYAPLFTEYLLDQGANPNVAYGEKTMLMCANSLDFSKMLIHYGANVNLEDEDGLTALDYAVRNGFEESVELLLQNGATVTEKTLGLIRDSNEKRYQYALAKAVFEAAENQNVNFDENEIFALTVLGKTEELIKTLEIQGGKYEPYIPFYAAGYCSPAALSYFVSRGFDFTQQDKSENSLLWIAASTGNLDVIKYLVENGASLDFSSYDPLDYDPLRISIIGNHYDSVEYMFERGVKFNIDEAIGYDGGVGDITSDKMKPDDSFQCAASNGNIKMIKLLEDNNFPMNENTYYRALKIAIVYDQREVIKYILDKGADPDYVDNRSTNNDSLLEICAHDGNVEILKLLDEYGVTINAEDSDALAYAVDAGDYEVAKYLLEEGMDINSHRRYDDGSESFTAWFEAGGHGYFDMVKLLLAHGADINDKSASMLTRYASGSERITKYLIENGADVNIR